MRVRASLPRLYESCEISNKISILRVLNPNTVLSSLLQAPNNNPHTEGGIFITAKQQKVSNSPFALLLQPKRQQNLQIRAWKVNRKSNFLCQWCHHSAAKKGAASPEHREHRAHLEFKGILCIKL